MRRLCAYSIGVGLALSSTIALAYEEETHQTITQAAVSRSVLQMTPAVLQDLGLNLDSTFPNTKGVRHSILSLLLDGAFFEDANPFSTSNFSTTARPVRHFYNPVTGLGLDAPIVNLDTLVSGPQTSSPSWALARPGTFSAQERSYWNARQSLFDALTDTTKGERDAAFGKTFQFLGQVVHHLQDMAQPQHVRNDGHFIFTNPSLYESWTNDVRGSLPTDPGVGGYDITSSAFTSTFNSPRSFWNTQAPPHPNDGHPGSNTDVVGKGIAEFTNRNFVSAGTNFDNPVFELPARDETTAVPVQLSDLCTNADPPCPNPNLSGPITMYPSPVTDNFTGAIENNPYASSLSIFDADLQLASNDFCAVLPPPCIFPGPRRFFTLNRFNFVRAHTFLIPRAVAYSAGMINYFFRGKIDLVPDDANPGTFLLKNLSNEAMNGTFSLYYDYDDPSAGTVDNRKLFIPLPITSIAANDSVNIGTIPADPTNPAPKIPGQYVLVFKGDMGAETTADFGAVVGKVVTTTGDAPFQIFIANWTGDFSIVGFELVVPQAFAEKFKLNPAGVSVEIDGVVSPFTAFTPSDVDPLECPEGNCVKLQGATGGTFDWNLILTENNQFAVYPADTPSNPFIGQAPQDLDLFSPETLCSSNVRVFGTALVTEGAHVFGQWRLFFEGKVLFEFGLQLSSTQDSWVLVNSKGVRVTDVNCRVSVQ